MLGALPAPVRRRRFTFLRLVAWLAVMAIGETALALARKCSAAARRLDP